MRDELWAVDLLGSGTADQRQLTRRCRPADLLREGAAKIDGLQGRKGVAIYEVETDTIRPVAEARFADLGLKERGDLQRLLRDRVHPAGLRKT